MYRWAIGMLVAFTLPAASAAQFKLPIKLAELEQRVRADSNDPAAHFNVALAYWNAKRWEDTDRALRTAIRLDARFAPAYVALNYLPYARRSSLWEEISENRVPEEWQERLEESDRLFRRAYMIDPFVELRSGDVARPRSTTYLEALELYFGEYLRDFYDGLDQYFLGEYQKSYDRLTRVLLYFDADRHPERIPNMVFWWHGLASARVEKWGEATQDFERLIDRSLEPTRRDSLIHFPLRTNEFRYILAYIKQRSGRLNEAIDLYRESLANDIGLYMAHVRLAEMYETAKMWPEAVTARRNAINSNPDDPTLVLDLGKTLAGAGQNQEAVAVLRQATTANPRDPRPFLYLGLLLEQQSQREDAKAAFDQFIALAPSRYERQVTIAKQHLAALQ
ncbi:MAG TPA: tetratricopeptide repeat protein [Gemmatimonadales bacterium]|nr:tetratricopeptide repeat protein [Gemmatimonadales bacterium]